MASSLFDLCSRPESITSFVIQGDRRQTPDRRRTGRGGRRADDPAPVVEAVDMRSIALRRAAGSHAISFFPTNTALPVNTASPTNTALLTDTAYEGAAVRQSAASALRVLIAARRGE